MNDSPPSKATLALYRGTTRVRESQETPLLKNALKTLKGGVDNEANGVRDSDELMGFDQENREVRQTPSGAGFDDDEDDDEDFEKGSNQMIEMRSEVDMVDGEKFENLI